MITRSGLSEPDPLCSTHVDTRIGQLIETKEIKMRRGITFLLIVIILAGCKGKGDTPAPGDQRGNGDIDDSRTAAIISPNGGIIEVSDGITAEVEPGTVSASSEITFSALSVDVSTILEGSRWNEFELLGGFHADAGGIELKKPIVFTLNTSELSDTPGFPLVLKVDPALGSYSVARSEIEVNPATGQVIFTLDSFSDVVIVHKKDKNGGTCGDSIDACRCGWIRVESEASDFMNNTCQISGQDLEIQFNSCPGQPIEYDHMSEVLGCDWYGTFDYYMMAYDDGRLWQEWHFLMDVYFRLGEDGIYGGGMGATTIDVYPGPDDCPVVKEEPTFDVVVSGEWEPGMLHINLLPGYEMDGAQFGVDCGEMSEYTILNYGTELRAGFMARTWEIPHKPITGHKEVLYSSGQDELALRVDLTPGVGE
jgi:hypothetical protein